MCDCFPAGVKLYVLNFHRNLEANCLKYNTGEIVFVIHTLWCKRIFLCRVAEKFPYTQKGHNKTKVTFSNLYVCLCIRCTYLVIYIATAEKENPCTHTQPLKGAHKKQCFRQEFSRKLENFGVWCMLFSINKADQRKTRCIYIYHPMVYMCAMPILLCCV